MSAATLKPLSKGKCLQDLKALYDKEFSSKNIEALSKSAPKLLQAARDANRKGEQEESYILFMRYLNIISFVQRSDEYKLKKSKFDLTKSDMEFALSAAEKLSKSLEARYKEQRSKELAVESASPSQKSEGNEEKKDVAERIIQVKVPDIINSHVKDGLSSMELYTILQDNLSSVLIIDVRPLSNFAESHINFDCCISISEEILEPGMSASKLASKLPAATQIQWKKRVDVDFLVLMDWFSSASNLPTDSPIHRLQTIILKWDPGVVYKSKPLILNGGFEDWLNHYPMYSTNAKPQLPATAIDDLLDIDDVIYPDLLDETPKYSRATKPNAKQVTVSSLSLVNDKDIQQISKDSKILVKDDKSVTPDQISSQTDKTPVIKEPPTAALANVPNVDRSSKVAALKKYKELEDRKAKVEKFAEDLERNREATESELKKLKIQQGRNELSDKEKVTLYQNEVNLMLRLQELQKSQKAKDEENELLRKELEEYKKRDQTLANISIKSGVVPAYLPNDTQIITDRPIINTLRANPSTPTATKNADLSVPSTGSGLKRSRSSPNIAQLMQDPESKSALPHFDRTTKPVIQKPQTLEFINRQRNFHEVYGTVKPGITGLKNLGNSCYMNSILQCISNISVLSNYFCNGKYKEDMNRSHQNPTRGEVAEEVAHVIRNLWLGQYRSIACRDLKYVVGKHMEQFRGCGQQDAHEFLTFLMDWLHNDLKIQKEESFKEVTNSSDKKKMDIDAVTGAINAWNDFRSKHQSFMLTAFFIQQVSTVQCSSCGAKSMNFEEPTSNLTLLLPSAARCTLSDCLRLYTSKERISGYKCESCHRLHDAEKSVDLCRLPPILIIHLKRFYSDGFYQKRQIFVDFPLENLDMRNYTPNKHQHHTIYNLCGVSNHYGTLEGGHYTAFCKNGSKWYKFDDQDVYEISRDEVKSASAYILFYEAVK